MEYHKSNQASNTILKDRMVRRKSSGKFSLSIISNSTFHVKTSSQYKIFLSVREESISINNLFEYPISTINGICKYEHNDNLPKK